MAYCRGTRWREREWLKSSGFWYGPLRLHQVEWERVAEIQRVWFGLLRCTTRWSGREWLKSSGSGMANCRCTRWRGREWLKSSGFGMANCRCTRWRGRE